MKDSLFLFSLVYIYIKKNTMGKIRITERDIKKALNKVINEQEEEMDNRLPVDDVEFELSDSDYEEIMDFRGPGRSFRGSIYYDGVVPETDDREYDRKLALAVLEYERRKMNNMETYVGGVGFKNRGNLIEPFDNMEF